MSSSDEEGDPAGAAAGPSTTSTADSDQESADCNPDNQFYKNQLIILKTMIQYHHEKGVFPSDDSAELFKQVKNNGVKLHSTSFSLLDMQILIWSVKNALEMDVAKEKDGKTPSFELHPFYNERFKLAKKIWGAPQETSSGSGNQEDVAVFEETSVSIDQTIKGPPGEHQENVGEKEVELIHSDDCKEMDMLNIAILRCILELKRRNNGVLPEKYDESVELYGMVTKATGLINLQPDTLKSMITDLRFSLGEKIGERIFKGNYSDDPISLHREIYELSKRIWDWEEDDVDGKQVSIYQEISDLSKSISDALELHASIIQRIQRKTKGPPGDHQENQQKEDVELIHSDDCMEMDRKKIAILRYILELKQRNNGVLLLLKLDESVISKIDPNLSSQRLEQMIIELQFGYLRNAGEDYNDPISLHQEIYHLSESIWDDQPAGGAAADQQEE
ncbi:hypothetical protein ACH5RR_037850 [Cinchona calisaya]|uniref:Uncharacterized protein n=1 Tax=Cinchona calisaya TaxID=153742 RepID=A0ABD2Y8Q8_9GENT